MRYYIDGVDALVGLDLMDVLQETFAASDIRAIQTLEELVDDGRSRSSLVISGRAIKELREHPKLAALVANGGAVVVVNGLEPPLAEAVPNWVVVDGPLEDATLIHAIQQARPGPSTPPED